MLETLSSLLEFDMLVHLSSRWGVAKKVNTNRIKRSPKHLTEKNYQNYFYSVFYLAAVAAAFSAYFF